jgi:Ca-activated chloride channel family protein
MMADAGAESAAAPPITMSALVAQAPSPQEDASIPAVGPVPNRRGPSVDFGATVHLSNDDSMSLASAQRVLAALELGYDIPAEHVRPHELLNYFSFDTAPVASRDMFSVSPSLIEEGDKMRLALAVQGAEGARRPLDLTLLVDRSGSMSSDNRMGYTKRGLQLMVDQLQHGDRLDLVLFDHGVCAPLKNFVVGRDDMELLKATIQKIQPKGSTNLDSGLRRAYGIQTERSDAADRNRRVMLLTDALLNTGNVNMDLVSEVGKSFDEHGIRLTGVGVGADFNDTMLNRLTEKGKGAYVFLGSEAVVDRLFGPGFQSLVETIAHNVRFSLDLPKHIAMERFYGEESSTDPNDVQPIHYYAGTSQLFLQDLMSRKGISKDDALVFQIRWEDARTGEDRMEEHAMTVGELRGADKRNAAKAVALMDWSDRLLDYAMSGECGDGFAAFHGSKEKLADGELDFVGTLLAKRCPVSLPTKLPPVSSGVTLKLTIDSDTPMTAAVLRCGEREDRQTLSGSDQVARFTSLSAGSCQIELRGGVPLRADIEVPSVDASATCRVRSGRISCTR